MFKQSLKREAKLRVKNKFFEILVCNRFIVSAWVWFF